MNLFVVNILGQKDFSSSEQNSGHIQGSVVSLQAPTVHSTVFWGDQPLNHGEHVSEHWSGEWNIQHH